MNQKMIPQILSASQPYFNRHLIIQKENEKNKARRCTVGPSGALMAKAKHLVKIGISLMKMLKARARMDVLGCTWD
ncbi:Uncharacterized protein TCM_006186 [Theobroma cacao]|uniref:Uncharacterized protein n=1 Tax=Theobroma cacao TaxID=3641 RepID=A0A061DYC4_THECC|nr:Uncharacterized protein TCM_006186 [Theobroma cacao]